MDESRRQHASCLDPGWGFAGRLRSVTPGAKALPEASGWQVHHSRSRSALESFCEWLERSGEKLAVWMAWAAKMRSAGAISTRIFIEHGDAVTDGFMAARSWLMKMWLGHPDCGQTAVEHLPDRDIERTDGFIQD